MLFVYGVEDHPRDSGPAWSLLCSSAFTLGQILVGPNKRGPADVAEQVRNFFHSPGFDLFLTNDDHLRGLAVPGIDFIAGMNVDLF
jgi:hypothetical protein